MAKLQWYLLVLSAILIGTFPLPLLPEKTLKIHRLTGHCPKLEHLPMTFEDVRIRTIRKKVVISTKLVVKRDIHPTLKVVMELFRCMSKEAPDTCEPRPNISVSGICELFGGSMQPWSSFITSFKPPLYCPFKKGVYVSPNSTMGAGGVWTIPLEGYYWKIYEKMYEVIDKQESIVGCTYVEGQVVLLE